MIKRFIEGLYLTKKEKVGYALAMVLLVVIISLRQFIPFFAPTKPLLSPQQVAQFKALQQIESVEKTNNSRLNLFAFNPNYVTLAELDSMNLPEFFSNNLIRYIESGGSFSKPDDLKKIYGLADSMFLKLKPYLKFENKGSIVVDKLEFETEITEVYKEPSKLALEKVFKPNFEIEINLESRETLIKFGFSEFAANNLLKYRSKGGLIKNKEELLSIYGIDSTIVIQNFTLINFTIPKATFSIELNTATIEDLDQIPGIGKTYAQRIIKYRQQLGGYYSINQIKEVYGLQSFDFSDYLEIISIDSSKIQKIKINEAEFTELLKHPYFEYPDVKSIFDLKEKHQLLTPEIIKKEAILNPKFKNYYNKYLDFSDE